MLLYHPHLPMSSSSTRPSFVEVLAALQHIRQSVSGSAPAPPVRLPSSPLPTELVAPPISAPSIAQPSSATIASSCPVSGAMGGTPPDGARLAVAMPKKLKLQLAGGEWTLNKGWYMLPPFIAYTLTFHRFSSLQGLQLPLKKTWLMNSRCLVRESSSKHCTQKIHIDHHTGTGLMM